MTEIPSALTRLDLWEQRKGTIYTGSIGFGAADFFEQLSFHTVPEYAMKFTKDPHFRREFYGLLDPQSYQTQRQAIIFSAHDDDKVLNGLPIPAIDIVLTNGDARNPKISPEAMADTRLLEGVSAGLLTNAAAYFNYGYKDGELDSYVDHAIKNIQPLIDFINPHVIFAPHPDDGTSPDHSATNKIALELAGGRPVYAYETPTLLDNTGKPANYTHIFPMTQSEVDFRTMLYDCYASQTEEDFPIDELADIHMVYNAPEIRARLIRKEFPIFDTRYASTFLHQAGEDILPDLNSDVVNVRTRQEAALAA